MRIFTRTAVLIALGVMAVPAVAQSSALAKDKADRILAEIKAEKAPDARQTVYEIKTWNNPDGLLIVGGKTSEQSVRNAIVEALDNAGISFADSIAVYP
ncbi:MAG: hypothetical protein K2F79_01045, partial [Muribaculaceae bacterium]|nr:hypothetical protein [Muribaculaceae bacterium]